jgi:hypothetical protein
MVARRPGAVGSRAVAVASAPSSLEIRRENCQSLRVSAMAIARVPAAPRGRVGLLAI